MWQHIWLFLPRALQLSQAAQALLLQQAHLSLRWHLHTHTSLVQARCDFKYFTSTSVFLFLLFKAKFLILNLLFVSSAGHQQHKGTLAESN